MNRLFSQTIAILKKDLLADLREIDHLVSLLLFGFMLLLLFSFGLSVESDLMQKIAPGLFWLAILFASILNLQHSFQRETENGQLDGLLLSGADPKAIYLGKMLANLTLILLIQLALLPFMTFLFDISISGSLLLILFLGSLGIATLGTSYANITALLPGGQVLLPLLLFPMLVPVLLSAVMVTKLTLAHDLFGQQAIWLELLILFDTVFLLGSLLLAETLFDSL